VAPRTPNRSRRPVWLIDLDDTLHRATPIIFDRMNRSMTEYVMRHLNLAEPEANQLRQEYWQRYGATLLGLMRRHGTDPRHFLDQTHQFPDMHEVIDFDRAVCRWLRHLPGRKILVSNAPRHYVMAVLKAMGALRYFDAIETIESMRFVPKPAVSSLRKLLVRHRVSAWQAVMVEDNLANLKTAHRLGLRTVWIAGPEERVFPSHVHLRVNSVLHLRKHCHARLF
jgi:putative hydrolase of the HAD superfamily